MKNPLITMSAITGRPTKEKIYNYLKGIKENGIDQVMLYPRSGCEIEYLSKAWFDTIGHFIFYAKELDMCLWLYDDFNWPSGDANGRVTRHEEYRLKAIKTKGEGIGQISTKSRHNSALFGEKYFPNLLLHDAVNYFIKCTHEEYYKRFGEHFGKTIKGMFTDEPSIGYCSTGDYIPYYDGIDKDYFALCGGDFYADMQKGSLDFYTNAIEVISNRFNECYVSRLANWCKEHNLIMTGHLMCDDSPAGATKHGGRFLKNLSCMIMPGIDEIYTDFKSSGEMTLFGAIEYASGKNGAMAELFALGPCDMTYAKKKCMLYLASAFKVDHYFLAISHLDMRGNLFVKDYFNNFNIDQPDFAGMKLLSKEAKKACEYAKKDFTPDVYVRYPFKESVKIIMDGNDNYRIQEITNELTYKGIQWKFIDSENPTDAPVITLDSDISTLKSRVTIKDLNGNDVKGIFVRLFDDGSILILNLFAPSGEYKINGKTVFLDEFSVLTSLNTPSKEVKEIAPCFNVKYCNDNIIRTMHTNGTIEAQIHVKTDTGAVFCARNDENVHLNDKKINCQNQALCLPNGMQEMYKQAEKITLTSGEYTIKAQNDLKYMPSEFIVGDFSYQINSGSVCQITLDKRKSTYFCGEPLYDYGKIELCTKITIPNGTESIQLQGAQLYTLVYANNTLLGEKITAPYIFDIDKNLWGKEITLKIVQYSSIAPIFGDVDYWDKNEKNVGWRGTPSPSPKSFGFKKLYFNF